MDGSGVGKMACGEMRRNQHGTFEKRVVCPDCKKERWVLVSNLRKMKTLQCRSCSARKRVFENVKYPSMEQPHRRRWLRRLYAIIDRCTSKSNKNYHRYGGRGISVCKEWVTNHDDFLAYVSTLDGWDNPELEFDRIDNEGDYAPGNVRCVPKRTNLRNTSRGRYLEYKGETICVTEFYERFANKYAHAGIVGKMLGRGKTPEQIIADMPHSIRGEYKRCSHVEFVDYNGEYLTVDEFWKRYCPEYKKKSNVQRRIDRGENPESIISFIRGWGRSDKRKRGRRYQELRAEE